MKEPACSAKVIPVSPSIIQSESSLQTLYRGVSCRTYFHICLLRCVLFTRPAFPFVFSVSSLRLLRPTSVGVIKVSSYLKSESQEGAKEKGRPTSHPAVVCVCVSGGHRADLN